MSASTAGRFGLTALGLCCSGGGRSVFAEAWSVMKSVSALLIPWLVVLYVWWLGLHWTVIGLGVCYAAALLLAIGLLIGESRGS